MRKIIELEKNIYGSIKKKKYSDVIQYCLEVIKLYKDKDNKKNQFRIYGILCDYYMLLQNYEKSSAAAKHCISLSKKVDNKIILAKAYRTLSIIYTEKSKFDEALSYLFKAKELLGANYKPQSSDDKKDFFIINTRINESIGDVYKNQKKYEKALKYYLEALNIAKENNVLEFLPYYNKHIGSVYIKINEYEKAYKYISKSLSLSQKANIQIEIQENFQLMSEILKNKKNFDLDFDYYEKYSKLNSKNHNKEIVTEISELQKKYVETSYKFITSRDEKYLRNIMNNLGSANKIIENYDVALQFYFQALKMSKNIDKPIEKAQLYYNISNIYYLQKKYDKAIEAINKSLELSTEIDETLLMKSSHELLAKLFEAKENFKEAFKHQKLACQLLNNSINEKEIIKKVSRIKKQQQLLMQKSKLESLGNLASGIAHEINQPLGTISMGIDNIYIKQKKNQLTNEYFQKKYELLTRNLQRIRKIIQHVRTFSQSQEFFKMEEIQINQLIIDACMFIKTQYQNHNIDLIFDLSDDIGFTIGSKQRLEQVILNLLSNSKFAVEKKSKQNISNYKQMITIRSYSKGNRMFIEVQDNGIGITEKEIDYIFDPFYSTKDIDVGTGLGLSISLGIIEEMKGYITFKSVKDKFTIAKISLPRYRRKKNKGTTNDNND